jgi:hypothetical protein
MEKIMKTFFVIAVTSLLLTSPAFATSTITNDIVVDGCRVSAGTTFDLLNDTVVENVRGFDGNCIAIPAGSRILDGTSGATRIVFPDGHILEMSGL